MRHSYLVAYDVSHPKRLRMVFRKLHGFGDPLQYSVFQCVLSDVEKQRMLMELMALIKHDEDRIMIVDVGPADGRARLAYEYLGRAPETLVEDRDAIIV